jgi:hypothetical protein
MQEIFNQLAAPFPTALINWRVGSTNERWKKEGEPLKGIPFCYVDARAVMDRLDAVVGPGGWQCSYTPGVGNSIVCNIGILVVGDQWIWKADGAGPSDMEAEKGALSDAFKRAAVRWGIGRYLYDIDPPKVVLEQRGKSVLIPKEVQEDLRRFYNNFARGFMQKEST